jgi:hypothetical protein
MNSPRQAGRISGQSKSRISGRIFNSAFKFLVRYDIKKGIRFFKGFHFRYLKHSIFYSTAVTVSRRLFWKFYELIWLSLQFSRISHRMSGYFQFPIFGQISVKTNPVSGRIPDFKKAGLSGRISGAFLANFRLMELFYIRWDCMCIRVHIVRPFNIGYLCSGNPKSL